MQATGKYLSLFCFKTRFRAYWNKNFTCSISDLLLFTILLSSITLFKMKINELEILQQDCKIKAGNLQSATDTLQRSDYTQLWTLQNYLSCVREAVESTTNLIHYLQENDNS